jgi:hypothetical protein
VRGDEQAVTGFQCGAGVKATFHPPRVCRDREDAEVVETEACLAIPEFESPKTSGKSTRTNWKQAEPTRRPEAECLNEVPDDVGEIGAG